MYESQFLIYNSHPSEKDKVPVLESMVDVIRRIPNLKILTSQDNTFLVDCNSEDRKGLNMWPISSPVLSIYIDPAEVWQRSDPYLLNISNYVVGGDSQIIGIGKSLSGAESHFNRIRLYTNPNMIFSNSVFREQPEKMKLDLIDSMDKNRREKLISFLENIGYF